MGLGKFLELVLVQKKIPRSGWIYRGVTLNEVESVAEHVSGVAVISLLLADLLSEKGHKLSVEKVLRMALLHDFHEAVSFDISKQYLESLGERGKRMKRSIEANAISDAFRLLPSRMLSARYERLVRGEYMQRNTLEAKTVYAADCFDLLLKVIDYQRMGYSHKSFDTMWNRTIDSVKSLEIPVFDRVLAQIEGLSDRTPSK